MAYNVVTVRLTVFHLQFDLQCSIQSAGGASGGQLLLEVPRLGPSLGTTIY